MTRDRCVRPGLIVRALSIRLPGRVILRPTSLAFHAGKIHLIIGPSGAGKTLMLRALAGLLDEAGAVTVEGEVYGANGDSVRPVLVPQHGGLLLELSTTENVSFAADHAVQGGNAESNALLQQLRVPPDQPAATLSGGEARRCAVARALAVHSPVVLYDEPTAGLDPVTAAELASAIRQQHDRHRGTTTIIVTHDYETLLPVADEVYLFDPSEATLRRVPSDDRQSVTTSVADALARRPQTTSVPPAQGWPSLTECLMWPLAITGQLLERLAAGLGQLLAWPRRFRWAVRFLCHYVRVLLGPSAFAYIACAGLIAGFVSTHFTFEYLPYRSVLEPFVLEEVLAGVGFTLYRVIVPVLVTLLIAARCGAAAAADIGIKSHTGQLDALRTFGASPRRYLLSPLLWVLLLGSLLLGAVAYGTALLTSLLTFSAHYPDLGAVFWYRWIHHRLALEAGGWGGATAWVAGKLATCGWLTGLIAYECAHGPQRSEQTVTAAITRTVLLTTLATLVVHVVAALVEF